MTGKYASSAKYEWQQSLKPKIAPLTVAVTGALAATSLQAATITVTTLDDGLISGQCSLRSALYAASSNAASNACPAGDPGMDTIVFAPGLNGTIQLVAGQSLGYGADASTLPIGDSVTIEGDNRITVRGTGNGGAFYAKYDADAALNAEDVIFSNITITNGGGEDRGGAIYSRSTYLSLENTTISNSNAALSGGGVHHQPFVSGQDKSLLIVNSTISGNFTSSNAAGGGGGGVYANLGFGGSIGVVGSTFDGNFSVGGNGGALSARIDDYAGMVVKYSDFENNAAKYSNGSGGGIFADLGYAQADFIGNNFNNNSAAANGGGLFLREDLASVQEGLFTLSNNQFSGNEVNGLGGGAAITVLDGGYGTIASPFKSVTLGGENVFVQNSAGNRGGGLHLNVGDTVVTTITGATFLANESNSGGAGFNLTAESTEVSIGDTEIRNNIANGGQGGGALIVSNLSGIYASDILAVSNLAAAGVGGGMQVTAGDSSFGIEYSRFYNNVAGNGCGGGLRVSSSANEVGVGNSIFAGNTASSCGGGMSLFTPSLENAIVEVKYNEVSNNYANGTGTVGGGGVFAEFGSGTTMFLKNSTISGNSATGADGGGVHFKGAMTAELKYSTVANNYGFDQGGGLFNDAATCNISNSILAGNENQTGIAQDLRGTTNCDVSNSLLAGAKYSQFNDGGGNILDTDPVLGPLMNNGGWGGYTHALLAGSPAIDAGSAGAFAPDYDQRGPGFARVFGPALDMGAYELRLDGIFSDRFEQP